MAERLAVALFLMLAAGSVRPAEPAEPRSYELAVRLEPDQRHVIVAGRVRVSVSQDESTLSFGLYEGFRIQECRVDGQSAACARAWPASVGKSPRDVTVTLPEGRHGETVDLEVRYAGAIENRPGWGEPDARALEKDPDTSLVKGNAHEAAHLWWRDGFGQGDWINETFAEYFALLPLRAARGEKSFRADLEEKRKVAGALPADAPAIAVVPFDKSGDGYTIRYDKGALMLEAFRERLGDEAFRRTCRGFYEDVRGRKAGTADFRAYWTGVLRDDTLLRAWLDSPGGLPAQP